MIATHPARLMRPLVLAAIAVLVGIMAVAVPLTLAVSAIAASVVVALTLHRPAFGALVMLALLGTIERSRLFQPGLPLGPGSLKIVDVLLLLTLFSWAVHAAMRREGVSLPPVSVLLPLAALLTIAVASVITAGSNGTPLDLSLLELRPMLALLLIIPVAADIRSLREAWFAVGAVIAIGVVAALAILSRHAAGQGDPSLLVNGAARIMSVPFIAPMLGLVLCGTAMLVARSARAWLLLAVGAVICAVGLFWTFQRGAWVALPVGVVVLLVLAPEGRRRRLVVAGAVACAIVAGVGLASSLGGAPVSKQLEAGSQRLLSIAQSRDVSVRYREAEWQRALAVIRAHPIAGIGLGTSISFWSPMYSPERKALGGTHSTYYIHNSYVWTALKLGIPGLLALIWLIVAGALVGLRCLRTGPGVGARTLLAGGVACLAAMSVLAFTGPHLTIDGSSAYVAADIGLLCAVAGLAARRPAGARTP